MYIQRENVYAWNKILNGIVTFNTYNNVKLGFQKSHKSIPSFI